MTFQAASLLQERDLQNSQLKRTSRFAVIGLWISRISLTVSATIEIVKFLK